MSSESDDRVDVEAPAGEAPEPADVRETEASRTPSAAGLEALAREQGATITVVGCGGAGCNTVDRMAAAGLEAADLVAMNTDVQHLVGTRADGKVLLGRETVRGEGAGSLPHVGERAALDSADEIDGVVSGSDMVFVTAGLGGGTGTGSAPLVARSATEAGALTVSIVTMPFTAEGEVRHANAVAGLERLRKVSDTVIVIANDRLLDCVGEVPVERAFAVADEVLLHSVKGVTDLVTVPGMVNLDFADVETVMRAGGVALIGFGEDDGDDRATGAVEAAVESPLLNVDMAGASAALVNVTGGPTMTIEEAEGVVEAIYDRVDPGARIIWGTTVDEDLDGTVRVMLILTGVESPQIYGRD